VLALKIFHRFHTLFLELKVVSTRGDLVPYLPIGNCIAMQLLLNKTKNM